MWISGGRLTFSTTLSNIDPVGYGDLSWIISASVKPDLEELYSVSGDWPNTDIKTRHKVRVHSHLKLTVSPQLHN